MAKYNEGLFMKSHPYKSWEVKSPDEYNWSDVGYDGHGYVLINGNRYDSDSEMYREEREYWNKIKSK